MLTSIRASDTTDTIPFRTTGQWTLMWHQFRRNRTAMFGAVITLVFLVGAVIGPYIVPFDPYKQSLGARLLPPSPVHWLGTDDVGRDTFSRIIEGSRYSLLISLAATCIATMIGSALGLIAAYYGKAVDEVIMRLMDILLSFPGILMALTIITALGPGLVNVVIAIGIHSVPSFARLAHGCTLSVKEDLYVQAAKTLGARDRRILVQHILPNISAPLVVQFSLRIATAVLMAASLSFLGLGVQPPTPEWGAMLSDARTYLRVAPYVALFPGLTIMIVVLGINLLGDGLRDILDPRLKAR